MRLIDADALEREYQERYKLFTWDDGEREKATLARVIQVLHEQPTIEERKTARWRPVQIGKWHGFECTACKINREVPCSNRGIPQWKYCPDCGAKMEE